MVFRTSGSLVRKPIEVTCQWYGSPLPVSLGYGSRVPILGTGAASLRLAAGAEYPFGVREQRSRYLALRARLRRKVTLGGSVTDL